MPSRRREQHAIDALWSSRIRGDSAEIVGTCDARFAAVREALRENLAHRGELGAAVAVIVEGRLVAELWCGWANAERTRSWREDTLVNVFSVGKALAGLCVLMLASHNILSPASGQPITVPTQDMVLGLYYLTKAKPGAKGEGRVFANIEEVLLALEMGEVETLSPIRLRYTGELIDLTTAYDDQDIIHTEPVQVERAFVPRACPLSTACSRKRGSARW